MSGIINEVEKTLARSSENQGVTYLRTFGNKFTLLETPGLWGQGPTAPKEKTKACQAFLDAIADVIGNAERTLDITMMCLPDGDDGFKGAISKGFKSLTDKGNNPLIRILLGAPVPRVHRKHKAGYSLKHVWAKCEALAVQALVGKYYALLK